MWLLSLGSQVSSVVSVAQTLFSVVLRSHVAGLLLFGGCPLWYPWLVWLCHELTIGVCLCRACHLFCVDQGHLATIYVIGVVYCSHNPSLLPLRDPHHSPGSMPWLLMCARGSSWFVSVPGPPVFSYQSIVVFPYGHPESLYKFLWDVVLVFLGAEALEPAGELPGLCMSGFPCNCVLLGLLVVPGFC